jgi:hypothetical protein
MPATRGGGAEVAPPVRRVWVKKQKKKLSGDTHM